MPRLSLLGLPSLSPEVLAFFSDLGIVSVEDFLVHDMYTLVSLAGHQEESVYYKQAVADILYHLEENHAVWWDGVDLFNILQQKIHFLPTGCESLDDLLQGGLRDGTVTEMFGASSSGKTQVCIQAAASAALQGATVAYIDTCNSFSALRLSEVVDGLINSKKHKAQQGLESTLQSVLCYRVHDVFSLLDLLYQMDASFIACSEGKESWFGVKKLRLLILDSISAVVAPVLNNTQVQGHAIMMSCGHALRKIASDNSICIMVTNHMVMGDSGISRPALGESWKAVPHVRLLLAKEPSPDIFSMSLIKHSSMRCNKQRLFHISCAGVHSLDA